MKLKFFVNALFVLGLFLSACRKYEEVPVEFLTEDYVYDKIDSSGKYGREMLNNLYSYLPNGYNRIDHVVLGAATDDAIASARYSNIELLSKGMLTALSNNPNGYWYEGYKAIRDVNKYLANIDKVPVPSIIKQYWKAEARFIRAMSYFELIKRYGGVPLIGNKLYDQDAEIGLSRDDFQTCVSYIVDELDEIKDSLRPDPVSKTEVGRITAGAALALKSRVLLYAASPLYNPENDLAKWQAASDAAKAIIDLNVFDLEKKFDAVFVTRQNNEVILAYQRAETEDVERDNAPVGYAEPNMSNGYVSPTQELVRAFPMRNGLAVSDPASGFNPDSPYINRDPRFYATVFYNGASWLGRRVQTFEGGRDKPNNIQRQTRTGYYMRKFMGDYADKNAYGNMDHNFVIFRYAEVLLNYAEAENELEHIDVAYKQLKKLRKRAGIEAGTNDLYGLKPDMTQAEMRKAIHLERRIEMAFEEQRYWDVRRWKVADTVFNKTLHGVQITMKEDSTFHYEIVPVQKIIFSAPKMYHYPIPYKEVAGNPSIEQNPGWN